MVKAALPFLLCLCLPAACQAESVSFALDKDKWMPAYEKTAENGDQIKEYVPKGQSAESWTEMVTVQDFPSLKGKSSSFQFMQAFINRIRLVDSSVKSQQIDLGNSPPDKDVLFEWSIDSGEAAQRELDRIISGKESLHVLHYCAKPTMSEEQHRQWLDVLKQARLSDDRASSVVGTN
jgi:hypothetical protein